MIEKLQIVEKLVKDGHITLEEAITLLKENVIKEYIYVPQPYQINPPPYPVYPSYPIIYGTTNDNTKYYCTSSNGSTSNTSILN